MTTDTEMLDWLEKHKYVHITPRNFHVSRSAASVELSYHPAPGGRMETVRAETVRGAIERAMTLDAEIAELRAKRKI